MDPMEEAPAEEGPVEVHPREVDPMVEVVGAEVLVAEQLPISMRGSVAEFVLTFFVVIVRDAREAFCGNPYTFVRIRDRPFYRDDACFCASMFQTLAPTSEIVHRRLFPRHFFPLVRVVCPGLCSNLTHPDVVRPEVEVLQCSS